MDAESKPTAAVYLEVKLVDSTEGFEYFANLSFNSVGLKIDAKKLNLNDSKDNESFEVFLSKQSYLKTVGGVAADNVNSLIGMLQLLEVSAPHWFGNVMENIMPEVN